MYYKKNEQNKCEQAKKCNKFDVAYYEVKKHDNGDKCKCDIQKTQGLIEAIENKVQGVAGNLEDADTALGQARDAVGNIPDFDNLVQQLQQIANDLNCILNQIGQVNTNVDTANERIGNAQNNIDDARETQGRLIDLIECLERQFGKTVWCLKKDDQGYPILVPMEKDYGCGYNEPKKCDCDWED